MMKFTDDQIIKAVKNAGGNRAEAARRLGIHYQALLKRVDRLPSGSLLAARKGRPSAIKDPLWAAYVQNRRNLNLRDKLVARYLYLAERKLKSFRYTLPLSADFAAVDSGVYEGLLEAVEKFDPRRGTKFETYAFKIIQGRALDQLRDADRVSRRNRSYQRQRQRAEESLTKILLRTPTDDELKEDLGWDEQQLAHSRFSKQPSLDARQECGVPGSSDSLEDCGRRLIDSIEAPERPWPADKASFSRLVRGLGIEEKIILYLNFYKKHTLKNIGKVLDLSESRISQLRSQALDQLKESRGKEEIYDLLG